MVGGRQDREVSEAGEARSAHDGLEDRGYPRPHRKGVLAHGEAAQQPPRQNPSQLHDSRSGRSFGRAQAHREPMDRGRTSDDRRKASSAHPWRGPSRVPSARQPAKQPCRPAEFYCLRCRAPKQPALDMADYIPRTATRGMLRGLCPTCERLIYRAASLATIEKSSDGLDVAFPNAEQPLIDRSTALSNVDFNKDERT